MLGSLSGAVELIFGIGITLIAAQITPYMPWFLAFAAGAMIYVVVEELIPEANQGEHSNLGTISHIFWHGRTLRSGGFGQNLAFGKPCKIFFESI